MQNIFIVFSALSVFIACMGLFGLAAYTTETRIKEIGIRKVLGASTLGTLWFLSRDVIKWIIIANVVAWPVAWIVMKQWLQNFAYKVEIGWIVFLGAFMISLLIAVCTFIIQTLKTANANPIDSIRHE
jgi:putative ABC transport system permease protein